MTRDQFKRASMVARTRFEYVYCPGGIVLRPQAVGSILCYRRGVVHQHELHTDRLAYAAVARKSRRFRLARLELDAARDARLSPNFPHLPK